MSVSEIQPLQQIRETDPNIRETFRASWHRRPICERFTHIISYPFIGFVSKGYQFFRSIVQIPLRSLVYHASSSSFIKKMDGARLEQSRENLRRFGGETILLKTEDGGLLEGMYLNVEKFRQKVISESGQFLVRPDGKYVIRCYNPDLSKALEDTFKFQGERVSYDEMLDSEYAYDFELAFSAGSCPTNENSQVTILTQGNAGVFEMDRYKIGTVLFEGRSCMVFNLRGTGRSSGAPNETRSYQDIEAVCQYLLSKGYSEQQITVNGYCLGAGLACDLASRRPVHLILDRPFARIGDVMHDVVKSQATDFIDNSAGLVKKVFGEESLARKVLLVAIDLVVSPGADWFVMSYNNASKVKQVRGSIIYIHSDIDDVIPKSSREVFRRVLDSLPNITIHTSDQFAHCDFFDANTVNVFKTHLLNHNLSRRHLSTAPPARLALHSMIRQRRRKEAIEAAKKGSQMAVVVGAGTAGGPVGAATAAQLSMNPDKQLLIPVAALIGNAFGGPVGGLSTVLAARHTAAQLA